MPKYFLYLEKLTQKANKKVGSRFCLPYFVFLLCGYVLQRRRGHDSGFYSLIAILKLSTDSLFFKLFGRLPHIFGTKNLTAEITKSL